MPFYEYQCAACGAHHEELQKITDRPLRKCPACGKSALRRLVSAPVFRLKGGGWYETDFKGEKDSQRNIAGDKEPAASVAPAADQAKDAKLDAKSEAKADAKPAKAEGEAPSKKADAAPAGGKTRSPTSWARAKRQRRTRRGPRR